jgi:LmbE family N-acetylglucosaminyl deacetylase
VAVIVAFHAHPDDEALLTGGTLARLAAEGHHVVIAVACDGVMGEASGADGQVRLNELRTSAAILGVSRVLHLGYADSGHGPLLYPDPPDRARFVRVDVEEAAGRLADLLRQEHADVLLSYDAQGGYGHRDHVKVHEVGARAAAMAGPIRVLEATLPREPVVRMCSLMRLLVHYDPRATPTPYSPRSTITHRVDVRRQGRKKRAAIAAHTSQIHRGSGGSPLLALLVHLPAPLFGLLLGWEWFVEPGCMPGTRLDDIFQTK